MDKKMKLWFLLGASLILMGCILFGGVMAMLNWDFTKLSTVKYETNRYEIPEEYENIQIRAKTADIIFLSSENSDTLVICHEEKNVPHTVAVKYNTLVIEAVDERAWYEYIGISFKKPRITVYLPQTQYAALSVKSSTSDVEIPKDFQFKTMDISLSTGSVTNAASASELMNIKTSTGNISMENISVGNLELSVSTGKITASHVTCTGDMSIRVTTGKATLTDIRCQNFRSRGSTGNLYLTNTVAAETFSIERSTGDVKLDGCDAAKIFIETDTGNVTGTLLTEKVFLVETDTGRIDVPKSVTGGRCEIETDTGDIRIDIK